MKRKVAIFGARGFIGRALSHHFANQGMQVLGFGRGSGDGLPDPITYSRLNVISQTIRLDERVDAVFYLSQSPYYRQFLNYPEHVLAVNVVGAVKAAMAAARAGARFFCYASTGNVYEPSFESLAEGHPIRRDNGYALSKVMAEEALDLVHNGMSTVCARLFGVFGPGQADMLVPAIFKRVKNGQSILLQPSAMNTSDRGGLQVSYCFIDDVVCCFDKLMQAALDGTSIPRTLNVAGPDSISIRRLANEQAALIGVPPHFVNAETSREFDLIADISRLRQICDPVFTDFSEAIARTFDSSLLKAAG